MSQGSAEFYQNESATNFVLQGQEEGQNDGKPEQSILQQPQKTANLNKVVVGDLPQVDLGPSKADTHRGNPGQAYELNSNSSMAQIVLDHPDQEPQEQQEHDHPSSDILETKTLLTALILSAVCSAVASGSFFSSIVAYLSEIECVSQVEQAPHLNELLLLVTCSQVIWMILQSIYLIRLSKDRAAFIGLVFLTVLSNIVLQLVALSIAVYTQHAVLLIALKDGMSLVAVMISTFMQVSVGILVLVRVCGIQRKHEMTKGQMAFLIIVICFGIALFTAVAVFLSLILTSEAVCPVCIAVLSASNSTSYADQTITWYNNQPASYDISNEVSQIYSQGICTYGYRVDAKQIDQESGQLMDLPAELSFDNQEERFTIQKCTRGVLESSPGDDPECMVIPFNKSIHVAVVYELEATPLIDCQSALLSSGFKCNPPFSTRNDAKNFTVVVRDPCKNDTVSIDQKTNDIYYVRPDQAHDQLVQTDWRQYLPYCPVECSLMENDQAVTHPAVKNFDKDLGLITLSSSDISLFRTTLILQVTCVSLSSEQDQDKATDTLTIQFQDPCQFDTVRFNRPVPISDYHIYYVYAESAEALIINHEFVHDRAYCPTACSLADHSNLSSNHEAIQFFDPATGSLLLSTANRELIGSSLSLQVSCQSTESQTPQSEVTDLFTVHFEEPCQFDNVTLTNSNTVNDYMIYYVYNRTADDLAIDPGFTHQLQFCPTQCRLLEADTKPATHAAVKSFDPENSKLVVSTMDYKLIGSLLTLEIECESLLSEKTRYASDIVTIKFEDPCQFDRVSFGGMTSTEDYQVYYINETNPYEIQIQPKFQKELDFCPSVCTLNEERNHRAIKSFSQVTGNLVLKSDDATLIGTSLSLQIVCTSLQSTQLEKEVSDIFSISFQDPCQFDSIAFSTPKPIQDYSIYYIEEADPASLEVFYGVEQKISQCPYECSLKDPKNEDAQHPAISSFDSRSASIFIQTSDLGLIDSLLSLIVQCVSLTSRQTNRTATDSFTISFQDPCQFDTIVFTDPITAADNTPMPYYIQANDPLPVTLEHQFNHSIPYCPWECSVLTPEGSHPSIQSFDTSSATLVLSSADTSLIDSQIAIQVQCSSTNSTQQQGEALQLYTVQFEDYCQFARVSDVELSLTQTEVEFFEVATFEYSIVSDNVNCPELNVFTRLKGEFEENERMKLEDGIMSGKVVYEPDTQDRVYDGQVRGQVQVCLLPLGVNPLDRGSTECVQLFESQEVVIKLLDPCQWSEIVQSQEEIILEVDQFGQASYPTGRLFRNNVTAWAEEQLQQEATCGGLKYVISYEEGQEVDLPIESLIKMESGTFLLKPNSKVLAGEYRVRIQAQMVDFAFVQSVAKTVKVVVSSYYSNSPILDMPKRQQFPSQSQMDQISLQNFKLSEIRFKQLENQRMVAILVGFANGVKSPVFGTDSGELSDMKIATIDTDREIKYASMRASWSYSGLRFYDRTNTLITEIIWSDEGEWTALQEVPEGQHIVGLKCDYESVEYVIQHLSFILGKQGESTLTGELRFPKYSVWPTENEFQSLYGSGIFKLSSIDYRLDDLKDGQFNK